MPEIKFALIGAVDGSGPCWFVTMEEGNAPEVVEVPKETIAPLLALHLGADGEPLTSEDFNDDLLPFAKQVMDHLQDGNSLSHLAPIAVVGDRLADLETMRGDFVGFEIGDIGAKLQALGIFENGS